MSLRRLRSPDATSFVWAMLDQAVVSGGSFATSIVLARALGPDDFSLWAAIWIAVFVALEFQLALAVVPLQVFTHEARSRGDHGFTGRMLTLALVFLVAMAALGLAVAAALEALGWASIWPAALAAAAFGVPFLACEFVRKLLFLDERGPIALVLDTLRFGGLFAVAALGWGFAEAPGGAYAFAWEAGFVSLAVLVVGILASGVRPSLSPLALAKTAGGSWSYSRWLVVLAGSRRAGFDLIYVLAGSALGMTAVGGLRILHQILSVSHIALQTMQNVVPGMASRKLVAEGPQALARYTVSLAALTIPAALALVGFTSAFDELLVVGLFGPEWRPYASALPVLAVGYAAMIAAYPFMFQLQAKRDSAALLAASVVASTVALGSFFPLTNALGIHGAAIAFSLALVVEAALLTGFALRGVGGGLVEEDGG
ncbi:lipopolysaccharide biosynthesis protein [Salinarimonas sp. NSM]|uniref:lipopolysaccharide biosynthesis protein n=1 Tax=Salinarimonas sp. NSM TaxID=3458003 RepID=UPI0040375CB8